MSGYDSDSSLSDAGDDVSTNVLLGYATKEQTEDEFSHLGGHPSFFPGTHPPPSLVTCRCCNDLMALLLQLNGDLPSRFTGHERRLYLWACKKKQCRRKEGSMRGVRGVRVSKDRGRAIAFKASNATTNEGPAQSAQAQPKQDLGSTLFGARPSNTNAATNPFSTNLSNPFSSSNSNPFSTAPGPLSSLAAKPPQPSSSTSTNTTAAASDLPATFAEKARISPPEPSDTNLPPQPTTLTPWPDQSSFPTPYPLWHLDAEAEYLAAQPSSSQAITSTHAALMADYTDADDSAASGSSSAAGEAEAGMTHDAAFQAFADRVAQNPEQVLRYEFGGTALLYARGDAVGRLLLGAGMPRCGRCGGRRVFELQLMPQAIVELEAEEGEGEAMVALAQGMDWGTVVLGVCERDCGAEEGGDGDGVAYVEEWIGVQWEEVVTRKR